MLILPTQNIGTISGWGRIHPELVVLVLFDDNTPNNEKTTMAQAILDDQILSKFMPGKKGGHHFEQVL